MSELSYLYRIRKEIRQMTAYQASPTNVAIKLDAMENPYPLPQELRTGWNAMLANCEVNRYPDASATALKQSLADHAEIPAECQLMLGNGSDELIQLIVLALACEGACLLSPEPSFSIYPMAATIAGMDYVSVPLRSEDFYLDCQQMLQAMKQCQPALICLAQPNNPTGNLWDRNDVETIIRHAPGYILLDEAYAPFAEHNQMDLVKKYPNLLILRTFSKIGFAGLRVGFLVGHTEVMQHLDKLRLPYNMDVFSQCAIQFILDNFAPMQRQIEKICQSRIRLFEDLQRIPNVIPFPSQTNFILLRVPEGKGKEIFMHLKAQGILVKHFAAQKSLTDCLRVSVGTDEENQAFITALHTALGTSDQSSS